MPADPSVRRALLMLLLVYLVFWPLVATLSHHSLPLDMIEGFVWSLNPQAGYYKHPPLPAWVIAVSVLAFGKQSFALLMLGPLCIVFAMIALWCLARQFLDERLSVVALFLTATQFYFNVLIPEFNHNVIQIPLWALSIALFWAATRRGHWVLFLALGLSLGLCLLAKYSAALLYLFLGFWLLIDAESRRQLSAGKVILCIAALLAVASPNLIWLVSHDFQSLNYVQERMGERLSIVGRASAIAEFFAAQVGINSVMIVLSIWLLTLHAGTSKSGADGERSSHDGASRFLLAASLLPMQISMAVPLIAGRPLRDMWAMMMFTTLGLALVHWRPAAFRRLYSRRWLMAWLVFQGLMLAAYAGNVYYKTQIKHSLTRANFPGPELAALIEKDWQEKTGHAPLRYVVGTTWAAGNVAFYAKATPAVLINGEFGISPWVTPERLSACGHVLLWAPEKSGRETGPWMSSMNQRLPAASAELVHASQAAIRVPVSWVIVPPTGHCDP